MVHWELYREEGMPEQLLLYRVVMDNPIHPNPCPPEEMCLLGIRSLFTEKPAEYWRQRTALETAYEERKKAEAMLKAKEFQAPTSAVHSEWDGKGLCPTCKREPTDESTKQARERGLKWLEEFGG